VADILLDTVDLTVFGGPTTVDVSVDFGADGVRGSKIWSGPGSPDVYLVGQSIQINDLYINTNTNDTGYGWLYQYLLQVGNPTWTKILQLNPSQYSTIATTSFSSGSTTIDVPLTALTAVGSPLLSNFVIRMSVHNANPVAVAFVPSIVGTNLQLVVTAAQYSSGSWSNLTGSKDVHLFISYKG
jgi:hypothetical protein